MSRTANVVIIGAGVVGSSVAYYLSKMGWHNIVVVDKGELYDNDGSTSHAPGGVVPLTFNKLMTWFGFNSVKLYKSLNASAFRSDRNPANQPGGMEVTRHKNRLEDLKRLEGIAKSYGQEAHMITPEDIKRMWPQVNAEQYYGGIFVPGKLIASGPHICWGLAEEARASGQVEFFGNTAVTNINIKSNAVTSVETNNPDLRTIECEHIVHCNNVWSPVLAEKIGVNLPLLPAVHQYAISEPLEELKHLDRKNRDDEVSVPWLRDLDMAIYHRPHWDCVGIGNYHHKAHMLDPGRLAKTMVYPFTPVDFEAAWKATRKTFPSIKTDHLSKKFNGIFAFSVDGMPIMGETPVKNFWVATASWLTHAGGLAKALAQIMTYGEAQVDTRQVSVNRFLPYQRTESFKQISTRKIYEELYDQSHPAQPSSKPRNIKQSPFYPRHIENKAVFTQVAGIELPYWFKTNDKLVNQYSEDIPARTGWGASYWSRTQGAEHLVCRNSAAMFDLSSLAMIDIQGPDALRYLNYLCTSNLDIAIGSVSYSLLCTEKGGILRDLTIARMAESHFRLFMGKASLPFDLFWLNKHKEKYAVNIINQSSSYSAIGLWGPKARSILEKVCLQNISNARFKYYRWQELELGMAKVFAMRLSYAGELGWELHIPNDIALHVWDTLWEAGQTAGIRPAGVGAFRSLRFEKAYRLSGIDITTEDTPFEAGMSRLVNFSKSDFVGRDALAKQKAKPVNKKLCTLTIDIPDVSPMGSEPIMHKSNCIGYVRSGNFGYAVGSYIVLAYLPLEYSKSGTQLKLEYLGTSYPCVVSENVLYDPENKKLKA